MPGIPSALNLGHGLFVSLGHKPQTGEPCLIFDATGSAGSWFPVAWHLALDLAQVLIAYAKDRQDWVSKNAGEPY